MKSVYFYKFLIKLLIIMSDEEARAEEPMEMATAEGADDDYQMDAPPKEEEQYD